MTDGHPGLVGPGWHYFSQGYTVWPADIVPMSGLVHMAPPCYDHILITPPGLPLASNNILDRMGLQTHSARSDGTAALCDELRQASESTTVSV
jgi:hypothetical protein